MTEDWRIAPGTFGCYEVSNLGRVRRERDGLLLKISTPRNSREYPAVMMRYIGLRKRRSVHSMVALAFVGSPPFIGAEVRHLDGDHCNPRWDNLAWGTREENAADRAAHGRTATGQRHGMARLTDEQRYYVGQSKEPTSLLAKRFGVHRTTIQKTRAALRARVAAPSSNTQGE